MKKIAATAALAALLAAAPLSAQGFGFGAHAGVSIPTGTYGGTDLYSDTDGFAKLGFSGGVDLWYPLQVEPLRLSWYTSADVVAHSMDESALGISVSGGYLYIPLMTGLRVDVAVREGMGAFVTGQLGLVLDKGPTVSGLTADSKLGTDFGLSFGGGIQFNQNLYAGLKFYPLGTVNFDYKNTSDTLDQKVSFLDIYVGFGVH